MRSKSIILLALALGCGLVASIGISQVLERRNQVGNPGETVPVFVAMKDINPNDPLTPEAIQLQQWPKDKVPPGALSKVEEVDGKRARTKLYSGETILKGKLIGADDAVSAATQIPKGYRVIQVKVDAVSGGPGLILPGDRVDVIMMPNNSNGLDAQAKTILQNIRVFSVDAETERSHEGDDQPVQAKTISLVVDPEQMLAVALASEKGSIRLVMRHPDDELNPDTPAKSLAEILGFNSIGKRDTEQGAPAEKSSVGSKLLDMLNKNKKSKGSKPDESEPWKMVLVEGSQLREVEFSGEDGLPVELTPAGGPGNDQMPPPSLDSSEVEEEGPADGSEDSEI